MVDGHGRIRVPALRPPPIPANVRAALAGIEFGGAPGAPAVDREWGEEGLTPAECVIAWNTLEVLAMHSGDPEHPLNAIPASARATMQMRFAVGTEVGRHAATLCAALHAHLAAQGYGDIEVGTPELMAATRLDPDNAWVRFALASIARSTGQPPVLQPNLGGSLPNDVFADILGLPPCGCRTATRRAPSTLPTSTCSPRWRARRSRS